MSMEILTVERLPFTAISVDAVFQIRFSIVGATPAGFTFPFSNESLTDKKLEFVKEEK